MPELNDLSIQSLQALVIRAQRILDSKKQLAAEKSLDYKQYEISKRNLNSPGLIKLRSEKGLNTGKSETVLNEDKKLNQKIMKGKVKVDATKMERFLVCADIADVKVGEAKVRGDKATVEISFNDIEKVRELGGLEKSLSDADVKKELADIAKRKAEAEERRQKRSN